MDTLANAIGYVVITIFVLSVLTMCAVGVVAYYLDKMSDD